MMFSASKVVKAKHYLRGTNMYLSREGCDIWEPSHAVDDTYVFSPTHVFGSKQLCSADLYAFDLCGDELLIVLLFAFALVLEYRYFSL